MRLVLLGSTGSIGRNVLEIVRRFRGKFEILALAAGENFELLCRQVEEFRPRWVAVKSEEIAEELKKACSVEEVLWGPEGLERLASLEGADVVVVALSGQTGVRPAYAAARRGKRIALANKESLVSAGHLIMEEAKRNGSVVLPVDSEHSALMQILEGRKDEMEKVYITASGGPFFRSRPEKIEVEDVLSHPVWKMGKKITVDSATLMNKAFEMVEAKWLFGLYPEQIDVLIHPQSVVHALVKLRDGSMVAHLFKPDMKIPILYALSWPERWALPEASFSLASVQKLEFYEADRREFPALKIADEMLRKPYSFAAAVNAANDAAVEAFLEERIDFDSILKVIELTVKEHRPFNPSSIEDVEEVISWARGRAQEIIERLRLQR